MCDKEEKIIICYEISRGFEKRLLVYPLIHKNKIDIDRKNR